MSIAEKVREIFHRQIYVDKQFEVRYKIDEEEIIQLKVNCQKEQKITFTKKYLYEELPNTIKLFFNNLQELYYALIKPQKKFDDISEIKLEVQIVKNRQNVHKWISIPLQKLCYSNLNDKNQVKQEISKNEGAQVNTQNSKNKQKQEQIEQVSKKQENCAIVENLQIQSLQQIANNSQRKVCSEQQVDSKKYYVMSNSNKDQNQYKIKKKNILHEEENKRRRKSSEIRSPHSKRKSEKKVLEKIIEEKHECSPKKEKQSYYFRVGNLSSGLKEARILNNRFTNIGNYFFRVISAYPLKNGHYFKIKIIQRSGQIHIGLINEERTVAIYFNEQIWGGREGFVPFTVSHANDIVTVKLINQSVYFSVQKQSNCLYEKQVSLSKKLVGSVLFPFISSNHINDSFEINAE